MILYAWGPTTVGNCADLIALEKRVFVGMWQVEINGYVGTTVANLE